MATNRREPAQPTPFGVLLKELRESRGLSQKALAEGAHCSPGYVGLLETGQRGKRPSLVKVKQLAAGLSANVSEMEALLRASNHLSEHESLLQRDRPTYAQFLASDRRLTPAMRHVLIVVYDGLVGSGASNA